jgi:hypothetical protein
MPISAPCDSAAPLLPHPLIARSFVRKEGNPKSQYLNLTEAQMTEGGNARKGKGNTRGFKDSFRIIGTFLNSLEFSAWNLVLAWSLVLEGRGSTGCGRGMLTGFLDDGMGRGGDSREEAG